MAQGSVPIVPIVPEIGYKSQTGKKDSHIHSLDALDGTSRTISGGDDSLCLNARTKKVFSEREPGDESEYEHDDSDNGWEVF